MAGEAGNSIALKSRGILSVSFKPWIYCYVEESRHAVASRQDILFLKNSETSDTVVLPAEAATTLALNLLIFARDNDYEIDWFVREAQALYQDVKNRENNHGLYRKNSVIGYLYETKMPLHSSIQMGICETERLLPEEERPYFDIQTRKIIAEEGMNSATLRQHFGCPQISSLCNVRDVAGPECQLCGRGLSEHAARPGRPL